LHRLLLGCYLVNKLHNPQAIPPRNLNPLQKKLRSIKARKTNLKGELKEVERRQTQKVSGIKKIMKLKQAKKVGTPKRFS